MRHISPLLLALMAALIPAAGVQAAAPSTSLKPASEALPGLGSWAGVRSLRLGKGRTVVPESRLALESAAGGHVNSGIAGEPGGSIRLQQYKGHVRGVVRSPANGTFLIKAGPDGVVKITELDASSLDGCDAELLPVVSVDGDEGTGGDAPLPDGDAPDEDAPDGDDGGVVDVLVVYTSGARVNAGSEDAMDTAIRSWVNESNDVYRNSVSAVRIRLVGTSEVTYTPSGSYSTDLARLAGTMDGFMDAVHTLRNDVGADVVVLVQADDSGCGIGYTIKNDSTGAPSQAFAVVRDWCADVNYTFTHELGHVMGCCHDADHAGSCAGGASLYPYSFGHRFFGDSGNWRSVMAYTDDSSDPWNPKISYTRVGRLSNPTVEYDNVATGTTVANNAATHDSMRVVTAAYRGAITPISCPGDLGEDAVVGVDDLLGMLQKWGSAILADAASLRADLNGDAAIDASDLLILLTEFGPCPS